VSDLESVRVGLECLRHLQGLDAAYQPLDEQCGHDLCGRILLERFWGILEKDISEYERPFGVVNLGAWEVDVECNGIFFIKDT
jgi:hypothetical protein